MRGEPVLLVHPHAAGPWIVQRGARRLAVPAVLGRALAVWHGARPCRAEVRAALTGAAGACDPVAHRDMERLVTVLWTRPRRPRRGPWVKGALLPPPLVARLARPLAGIASGGGLAVTTATGLAALTAHLLLGGPRPPVTWSLVMVAVPLFLATALFHELGHAAALLRRGYAPGAVGVGVLFVLPVLWCDVSPVELLAPRRRVAVDLAGPAFQLAAAGTLFMADILLPASRRGPCALAGTAALAALVWSLIPFIRSDGFWALGDLLGVGDLDRSPRPWEPRRTVLVLRGYRLLHTIFLAGVGVLLSRRAAALLAYLCDLGSGLREGLGLGLGTVAVLAAARRLLPRRS